MVVVVINVIQLIHPVTVVCVTKLDLDQVKITAEEAAVVITVMVIPRCRLLTEVL